MAEIDSSSKKTPARRDGESNVIPFVFTKQRDRRLPANKDQELFLKVARDVLRLVNDGNLKHLSVVALHAQKGMLRFKANPDPCWLDCD